MCANSYCKIMFKLHFALFALCTINHWVAGFDKPALYQVTDPIDHGEAPTWNVRNWRLYFVDVYEGRVLSYHFLTAKTNAISLGGTVTPVIPSLHDPDLLIVGVNRSVLAVKWNGSGPIESTQILTTVAEEYPTSRLNDGKADKEGRLWLGTMGFEGPTGVTPDEGVLYLITKANLDNPLAVLHPVNISNGMAWNQANNKFYYIDTQTFTVRGYDYDNVSGNISNPKVVFDVSKQTNVTGYPDGMTIDKEDNLWIAMNYGGAVAKIDPNTGTVLQVVAIPSQAVTSLSWGGPSLDILFVTTSRHGLTPEQQQSQPAAGSLFAIKNLGTSGLPAFKADITG